MTGRERFVKALKREKIEGHIPHFELVFYLTMEAFGKVHPTHRHYSQWGQMSIAEKKMQINDMADIYIETAKRYHHDAIFVHPNPSDLESIKELLYTIREKSGAEYYLMMTGDVTVGIPNGDEMIDFSMMMYEEPEKIHEKQEARKRERYPIAKALSGTGLLDGYALCSDYSFNVNPFFPSELFGELVAPHLSDCIKTYKDLGYYTIKHTDGNINPILDQIVACKPDALHSIDPQGGMNLKEIREKYGDRICTIGNVNCGLLQTGTEQEAIDDIRRALKEGMENGYGHIFSTSNCAYTGLPLERYELLNRIWREEGIYPSK